MPVKLSTHFHWGEEDGEDMANLDVNDIFNTTPFLSDDIWKKFELDLPIGDDFFDDIVFSSDAPASSSSYLCQKIRNYQKIRNHDCMWAGQCGSKDHPADEQRAFGRTTLAIAPVLEKTPVAVKQTAVANNNNNTNNNNTGRSLLIKTVNKQPPIVAAPVVTSPDSPPMSDDEEIKAKTKTLQFLHDAISECDLDEDSDLCEYFEEEELLSEPVEETTTTIQQPRAQHARENDHSYHKDKNSSMRVAYLGIDTPSDSEEEIDVVSISEKQNSGSSSGGNNNNNNNTNNRMTSTLPNNPTLLDRQQIQKTMATAITNKQVISSPHVKTISPPRKSSIEQTPKKRKLSDSRRMKRSRYQYRMGSSGSPYKKRGGYNHSSDSEQEPSEKRSLHNNMERQRRVDLRNAFEDLKSLVPEVSKKERAAKVVILREAAVFCDQLGHTSESMKKQLEDLRRQQHRLRARVSQLRKSLASKHR